MSLELLYRAVLDKRNAFGAISHKARSNVFASARARLLAAKVPHEVSRNKEWGTTGRRATREELVAWCNAQAAKHGIIEHEPNTAEGRARLASGKTYLCSASNFGRTRRIPARIGQP